MQTPFDIGSIASRAAQPCEIAHAILNAIEYANKYRRAGISIPKPYAGFGEIDCDDPYWKTASAIDYVDALEELMGEHAPPYCYFGVFPNSDWELGFWPDWETIRDELPRVESSDQAAKTGHGGYSINDHGNVTLYGADGREIWSCV